MLPAERLVLIDLENVVGFRPKPRTLRTRVTALLDAVGPFHHAVAAYAGGDLNDDPIASMLAALGVAPLRIPPGPDNAETALLAHARRMQVEGCVQFTVCSSDHAFATLASGPSAQVEVLVWEGQPVSTKLSAAVDHVRFLPRPGVDDIAEHPPQVPPGPEPPSAVSPPVGDGHQLLVSLAAGLLIGLGMTIGHRVADLFLPEWRRGRGYTAITTPAEADRP